MDRGKGKGGWFKKFEGVAANGVQNLMGASIGFMTKIMWLISTGALHLGLLLTWNPPEHGLTFFEVNYNVLIVIWLLTPG